tara:strand:+ start:2265 stop:2930 length:666 start_codon:yes stop_codon:yes gene_type:complete
MRRKVILRKIVIIDTGSSNILSLKRAVEIFDSNVEVSTNSNTILSASKIFFPGVGAFKKVMEKLEQNKLAETLIKTREKKIPLLGICLGLQLFFDKSEEFGITKGLGLINGNVKKLPNISQNNEKLKIPNMGWFKINLNNKFINNKFSKFVQSINENNLYYFVHSYFVDPIERKNIAATYNFGGHNIPAIVSKDNFIGCQFHPEKSGKKGLEIISNFLKLS